MNFSVFQSQDDPSLFLESPQSEVPSHNEEVSACNKELLSYKDKVSACGVEVSACDVEVSSCKLMLKYHHHPHKVVEALCTKTLKPHEQTIC